MFFGALGDPTYDSESNTTLTYLPDFFYPPQLQDVQYPSCAFSNTLLPGLNHSSLADFAFLSSLAYRSDAVVGDELEGWFGPNENVTDQSLFVHAYRTTTGTKGIPVFFRLFRYKMAEGTVGIVSVRGSTSTIDWLVNNQLWQAAILVQGVRALLPVGAIFTPALPSKFAAFVDLASLGDSCLLNNVDFASTSACQDHQQLAISLDISGVFLQSHITLR
jgi:hypothetical protein